MQTNIELRLSGEDGNAFARMAKARRLLQRHKMEHLFDEFEREATSEDYDHLLQVCMRWFSVT